MARSGDSSDTIESVSLGESGGYDGSGEYDGSVGPCESDSGDPCDTYMNLVTNTEQMSRIADELMQMLMLLLMMHK